MKRMSVVMFWVLALALSYAPLSNAVDGSEKTPEEMNVLGVKYFRGEGVRQSYADALEWFKKAALQGDIHAQNNLASMYLNGQGVRQDYAIAKEWFGKACDGGSSIGCARYSELNTR